MPFNLKQLVSLRKVQCHHLVCRQLLKLHPMNSPSVDNLNGSGQAGCTGDALVLCWNWHSDCLVGKIEWVSWIQGWGEPDTVWLPRLDRLFAGSVSILLASRGHTTLGSSFCCIMPPFGAYYQVFFLPDLLQGNMGCWPLEKPPWPILLNLV